MKKLFFLLFALPFVAQAGNVSVTSVTAQQRDPWDSKVDVVVTLQGAAEDVVKADCLFSAKNSATQAEIPVKNITRNGDDASSGGVWMRKFIWDARTDIGAVKIDDVALTVEAGIPHGGVQLWENGPYWAECNVGASQPEECGHYFWWGDTVGYKRNSANNGWVSVEDGSSFSFDVGNCPTYGKSNSRLLSAGYIDAIGNLAAKYDVATVHLGAPWRMPTAAEIDALISNCTTTWTTRYGVVGRLVTGKGAYASKSIFLPAAGFGHDSYLSALKCGFYMSSTPYSDYPSDAAWHLFFDSSYFERHNHGRSVGQSVRPVRGFSNGSGHFVWDPPVLKVMGIEARQRYPWNGLVDIVVTIRGTVEDMSEAMWSFAAIDSETKVAIPVVHVTRNGDDSVSGTVWTRKFIWDAKVDVGTVKIDDVALTVGVEPPYVQLWENGPYWAKCNVGATNPEEYGYYFWWGDTVGYKRNAKGDGWISVEDSTSYSFQDCPTYRKNDSQLRSEGYIDSEGNLDVSHDAARAHLGAPWRMPTDAEFSALISNCITTWTTRNGVCGQLVMGRGDYSSKSIFLPAAGKGDYSDLVDLGSYGVLWSSTPTSDLSRNAWILDFSSNYFGRGYVSRYTGKSVRPVWGFANVLSVDSSDGTTHFVWDPPVLKVTGVEAQQRYPWNGLVDVAVTIQGMAEDVAKADCLFAAMNSETKTAISVNHIIRDGDDTCSGNVWTRKFIWDARADVGAVKIDDVALTVVAKVIGGVQLWENGPYWAECNVGASMPEEAGYYFWCGDTVGYKRNANNDGWISVKDSSGFSFTDENCHTYGKDDSKLLSEGYIDETGNLVAAHDAATAYLGAPWRMPTTAEISSLKSNCTMTWTTRNGVNGRLVTGKGMYASRSIFLPAVGEGYDSDLYGLGSDGGYWSSTLYSSDSIFALYLYFSSSDLVLMGWNRSFGRSVRPLRESADSSAAIGGVTTHLSLDCQVSCHTITFDPNGGNCSVVSKSCENGALIGALPDATRNGYMFEGWYTAASGGMKVTIETIVTEDVTLYAHWVSSAEDITLSDIEVFSGYPWHEVVIGYRIAGSTDQLQTFEVTARDNATGKTYECKTLDGVSLTTGSHVIKWNASADGAKLKSENVVFTVRIVPSRPRYCVIDLSGGANAARYPVVWLEKMPSSGWTDEYKTKKLVLRRIEAGSFMMGGGLFNNEVLHSVVLTKPCYMGVFEVTQSQWELVMGANPSYHKNEMCPVECISYDMIRGSSAGAGWPSAKMVDASSFVGKLQEKTGLELDLPTEAQWEYACRAGTTTRYYWGSSIDGSYAWYRDNSESFSTQPVGTREANPWGLYDMSGNVWEWCLDWYVAGFSVETDPEGPDSGVKRVTRGGSSYENEYYCTSTVRGSLVPSDRNALYGFRLVGSPQGSVSWIAAEEGVEALAVADSGCVSVDTTYEDGTIVTRSVPIAYGSVASVGCCITANGVEIVNSMMRGTKDWALISGGEYKLVYSCGDVMMESVVAKIDSGNYTDAVVGKDVTGLDELVTVSATWVTDFLVQHFGTGKEDSFRQLFGGDLAAALAKPTGKHGPSGEVRTVWDDYVAGTDPTDPASVFTTTIAIVDGKVVLDWSPNLNLGSVNRLYRVKSKLDLSDTWTCPPVADHHFFMTEVALPDGKTQTASPGVIGNASSDGDGEANKLAHRWSFNGNLNDSVGNRTATAVGSVSSDGSTYTLSGVSGTVAYIDLGTGLFANGVTEFTIETWVTPYATGWRRIWDMADLFGQCWNGKDNLMGVRDHVSWTSYTTDVKTYIAVVCTALPSGGWSLIYYHLDAETGATLSSYASTTVGSDWSPQKVGVNALLLGKSNAPQDPYGNASYDEFRIWNKALSEDELKKSVEKGPDTLP